MPNAAVSGRPQVESVLTAWYNVPPKVDHCIRKVWEGVKEYELMTMQRRQHSGAFKAKVVLEALRGERPWNEIAAAYGLHPLQMTQWKKVALEGLPTLVSN